MRRFSFSLAAMLLTLLAGFSSPGRADDIDLYLWQPPTSEATRPNILLMFSAANTMLYELRYKEGELKDMNADGDTDDTEDQVQGQRTGVSRLDALKEAVVTVLDVVDGVNIGFGRFVSSGGSNTPILYPVKYINEQVVVSGSGIAVDQISESSDDAEESASGSVTLTDPVVEMVEGSGQEKGTGSCNGDTVDTYYYNSFNSAEDAYQELTSNTVAIGELRAGYDGANHLLSGMRYAISNLPQEATIHCVELTMTAASSTDVADWSVGGSGLDMDLMLEGSAADFSTDASDLSGRTTASGGTFQLKNVGSADADTVTVVAESGDALLTQIQALVDDTANWTGSSDSIALLMQKNSGDATNTTPLLFTDAKLTLAWDKTGYVPASGGQQKVALRFQNLAVPSDVTITDANLTFTSDADASGAFNVTIAAEQVSDSPALTSTATDISGRTLTTAQYDWSVTADTDANWSWTSGTKYTTPAADDNDGTTDLKDVIQEVVDQADWCGGLTALTLVISATNADESPLRNFVSYDGVAADDTLTSDNLPTLRVEYDTGTMTANSCIQQTYQGRILESVDDAEETVVRDGEYNDHSMWLTSGNLEITDSSNNSGDASGTTSRIVGLRFQSVPIKHGTPVDSATLTFKASANASGTASFLIYGEMGDSGRFQDDKGHLSKRLYSDYTDGSTTESTLNANITTAMEWDLTTGEDSDTGDWRTNVQDGLYKVDISPVVQEIVNSDKWESYQNMAFYIVPAAGGGGLREAIAYDANTGKSEGVLFTATVNGILGEEGSAGMTSTVRDYLKQITRELRACYDSTANSCSQLVIDALHEAGTYYLGGQVMNGGNRNNDAYNRVSHEETFTGGTLIYGGGSMTAEEAGCDTVFMPYEDACSGEKIDNTSGTNYVSPITSSCAPNHIIMISDGKTTANTVSGSNQFAGTDPAITMATELGALGLYAGCSYQGSKSATTYADGAHFFDSNGNYTVDAGERRFGDYDNSGGVNGYELSDAVLDNQNEKCGPDIAAYLNKEHKIKTHVIGFALGKAWQTVADEPDGDPSSTPAQEDVDQTAENYRTAEFLRYLAHRGGGGFYEAESAEELAQALIAIISKILSDSATFTAPSLSLDASSKLYHSDELYNTMFQPGFGHRWAGNVKKYQFNDCQGVTDCTILIVDKEGKDTDYEDDPTTTEHEAGIHPNAADLWNAAVDDPVDYDVGGISPGPCSTNDQKLNLALCNCYSKGGCDGAVVTQGGAGSRLPAYATRNVFTEYYSNSAYTLVSVDNDDSTDPNDTLANDPKYGAAGPAFDANVVSDVDLGVTSAEERSEMIDWIRGADVDDELEDGDLIGDRWAFGDPLHSSPIAVTFGETSGGDPVNKLFVATNDGFLRMINPETGQEEWGFIPNEMLLGEKQKTLRENENFDQAVGRVYGLDGPINIYIVDQNQNGIIEPNDGSNPDSNGDGVSNQLDGDFVWLYVGMRRGGRNIYAIDVTPSATLTDNNGSATSPSLLPKVLWVAKGGTGDLTKLGQTWSSIQPTNIYYKRDDGTQGKKSVVIVGGGYDPDQDDAGPDKSVIDMGNAIYILHSRTGEVLWWASGSGSGANLELPGMDYSIPSELYLMDSNSDNLTDRIYVGDTGGQVWRIDLGASINSNDSGDGGSVGGMLASVADTSSEAGYRSFFYPPGVMRADAGNYFYGGDYDAVVIVSGTRPDPLGTTVNDRIYVLRDRANTGLKDGTGGNNYDGSTDPGGAGDGLADADGAGWVFPVIPNQTPADEGDVGLATDALPDGSWSASNPVNPVKTDVVVSESSVASVNDAPANFFTIRETWMYDATDNEIDPTSDDVVGDGFDGTVGTGGIAVDGGLYVNEDELKQLQACPGWYITLENGSGEKGLSQPLIAEGKVFITTFVPIEATVDADGCPIPQDGYGLQYGLDINTGMAVTDWDSSTKDDDMNELNSGSDADSNDRIFKLGFGLPPSNNVVYRPGKDPTLLEPEVTFTNTKTRLYWYEE